MEIRSGLEGLRSLLGVDAAPGSSAGAKPQAGGWAAGTDSATLSAAASEVAQSASGDNVRSDKVTSIQAAIAAGTYHVPASAVASKLVDAMLGSGQ